MTTVYVKEPGATVRRQGERLVVTKDRKRLLDLPLLHLEQLALVGNVQLTTPAVAALLERQVDVVFLSGAFRYRGRLVATGSKLARLRQAQMLAMTDMQVALPLAKAIVAGKLVNQRSLLQRRLREAQLSGAAQSEFDRAQDGMKAMLGAGQGAADLDSLRGYEGKAAAWYFGAWRVFLDPVWGFKGRQYHPAPDPVNAVLGFGYALLLRDAVAAAELVGLDPYLGFFHASQDGRPSLALDLMEEFRPLMVDRLILGLLARGGLTAADFTRTADPRRPVSLSPEAARRLVEAYETAAAGKFLHAPSGTSTSWRRCLELQARQVAALVTGKAEAYLPVVAR